jgi:protein phosphatase
MLWVQEGSALYTPGNHCDKLKRFLQGRNPKLTQGLDKTVAQVEEMDRNEPGFKDRLRRFIEDAPLYLWLDGGRLAVAHAGIKRHMIGHGDGKVRTMVLYGDITGETNPDGTPVRLDWAQHYQGDTAVIYGHTPTAIPRWRNNTANVDQGCVFGGWLSAARWPERDFVQVDAHYAYYVERTPAFLVRRVHRLRASA